MTYSQKANPNATNSELDAKVIIKHPLSSSDEKFYAQRDANFKDRVYRILFDDPSGHSDEEVLELITQLKVEDNQVSNLIKEVNNPTFHMDQAFAKAHKEI